MKQPKIFKIMSNISKVKTDSDWGTEASVINQNFQNVSADLEKVKSSTTKFKGYFTTEESLKNKFGSPKEGDTAWVGEPYPGTVYDVQTDGQWHNTGKAPDTGSVELQDYAKKAELTELEGKVGGVGYVTCDTAAGTAAKVITVTGLTVLSTGIRLLVKMTYSNTASNATLNINGLGAKPLYYNNTRVSGDNTWEAGEIVDIYYDGTNFYSGNFQGGSGEGGNLILEWNTDAATTRKQVKQSDRKSLLQISYKDAEGNPVNEQYIGNTFTDTEWAKDSNWNKIPTYEDIEAINESLEFNYDMPNISEIVEDSSENKYINGSGVPTDSSQSVLNTYNNIDINKSYYAIGKASQSGNYPVGYYDSDGAFLSGEYKGATLGEYTLLHVPDNCYTIKVASVKSNFLPSLKVADSTLPKDKINYSYDNINKIYDFLGNSLDRLGNNFTKGVYYNTSTGVIVSNVSYACTTLFLVDNYNSPISVTLNGEAKKVRIIKWDKSGTVTNEINSTFVITEDIVKIGFNIMISGTSPTVDTISIDDLPNLSISNVKLDFNYYDEIEKLKNPSTIVNDINTFASVPKGSGIILSDKPCMMLIGASFATNNNGWFELACEKLGCTAINKAVSGSSIIGAANSYQAGTLWSEEDMENSDVLVVFHVHNYNVYDASDLKDSYTEYESEMPFPDKQTQEVMKPYYTKAYDYIIKKYISDCYELRNKEGSRFQGTKYGKPAQIVILTHWHDARTLFNDSVRKLCAKWRIPLVRLDEEIGFTKNCLSPDGNQFSTLYASDKELIDGIYYGQHPLSGKEQYIQKKIANIFIRQIDVE